MGLEEIVDSVRPFARIVTVGLMGEMGLRHGLGQDAYFGGAEFWLVAAPSITAAAGWHAYTQVRDTAYAVGRAASAVGRKANGILHHDATQSTLPALRQSHTKEVGLVAVAGFAAYMLGLGRFLIAGALSIPAWGAIKGGAKYGGIALGSYAFGRALGEYLPTIYPLLRGS